jgi:hypothetical protein
MSAFHVLKAELKKQGCLDLVQKCLNSGALTQHQAKQVEAQIARHAADEIAIAKAIHPGPSLQEIIKHGYFSDLPKAPFQRGAHLL